MNLRNKLLLSFLIFIVALVALGVWSALSLRELGGVSRRIIAPNYDSVVPAQDMKEKDVLYACREEGERLERLMRDLTDLSRIESGEVASRLAPVRVEDVVGNPP